MFALMGPFVLKGWNQTGQFSAAYVTIMVKRGTYFPAEGAKIARGVLQHWFPGTLQRIQHLSYFQPETHPAGQNRPWISHAGGQDDGSSQKLPQTMYGILVDFYVWNTSLMFGIIVICSGY